MQLFEKLNVCFGNTLEAKLKGGCGWAELSPIANELLNKV